MNRRERLMATLRGEPVDRPAVSFYELNGLDEDYDNPDPFNIYTAPSWRELIALTRDHTDRIVMRKVPFVVEKGAANKEKQMAGVPSDPLAGLSKEAISFDANGSRIVTRTINAGNRTLTSRTRQDRDVNTIWTLEHLLKDVDDLKALLQLDFPAPAAEPDVSVVLDAEAALGDAGIVMIDTPDPLCLAAALFDMATYTVVATLEPALFHELLSRFAAILHSNTRAIAKALPGRLWRIYGPEYASPPYQGPAAFRDYVVRYDQPMVDAIQQQGGFVRIHSHGNLKLILDDIASMGVDGLDPIEPPSQGDVELSYVRQKYGEQMVLFGNLEATDLENMPTDQFAEKIKTAIEQGTAGQGRGFVLMPSACPYGRKLLPLALANYKKMVEMVLI
ncbi:MAG: hypothetical protein K9M57_01290 [Phycisphaerae bacterium]|nr:hypothetical protein [Phycisphaerae bacterium]